MLSLDVICYIVREVSYVSIEIQTKNLCLYHEVLDLPLLWLALSITDLMIVVGEPKEFNRKKKKRVKESVLFVPFLFSLSKSRQSLAIRL